MMASTQEAWRRYVLFCVFVIVCSQPTKANDFRCKTNEVQFSCPKGHNGEGKCIPKDWECDNEDDCGDNSDEQHCNDHCLIMTDQFYCHDRSICIKEQWTCDGYNDCPDGSDEFHKMCDMRTCSPNQFKCTKKNRCIPLTWRCDGEIDCGSNDESDEMNCSPKNCSSNMFKCHDNKCIDIRWKCDYEEDCDDKSDEINCEIRSCTDSEFTCTTSRQCISKTFVCDKFNDCKDNSDEPPHCKQQRTCKNNTFECNNGECIKKEFECDGDKDCLNGEDERNCSCSGDKVSCDGKCIFKSQICDGKPNCQDGSDEVECVPKPPKKCTGKQFMCETSKKCIDNKNVCDNISHCDDKSDESEKCLTDIDECQEKNGGCAHKCINLRIGRRCVCVPGYELKDDKSCQDINECAELGACSQTCKNIEGKYKCSCVGGYLLDGKDLRSCKAIERDPYLVFADRHSIRKLTLQESKFLGVVPDLAGSIALDYDLRENRMYWTDVHSGTIQRISLSNSTENKVEVIVSNINIPDGIAVDWVARKLYWTDAGGKCIEVSELDGKNRRVLINVDVDMPRAVVLHPALREVFWTDWGVTPKIEKCGMDGDPTSRKAIITKDIIWPNALTVDYTIDRIWWADAKRHVIEHCDLNGKNRKVILTKEHVYHPFSISVFEDHVYWTDWIKLSISKVNKFTGENWTVLKENLLHPMGISVIHPQRQPAAFNFCQKYNGGCSHLCLLSARRNKSKVNSCLCPDNIKMLPDGMTCDTPESLLCTKGMCNNGTCLPGNKQRGPICRCNKSYGGMRCEYQLVQFDENPKQNNSDDNTAVTIGISVGVVVLIFICGAIVGIVIYKKLQKRYNPTFLLQFDDSVYVKTTESIESGRSLIPLCCRRCSRQPPFSEDPEPVDL